MLINSTTELKEYLPASVALDWDDIRPKVRMVEREVIRRIFSTPVYERIQQLDATDTESELRQLLSEAVAHLALMNYIDFGQVQISSAGIQIASNDNMKTAFEWQTSKLKEQCSLQGWGAVESALELLDGLSEESDLLTLWQATDTYALAQHSLIRSLREFQLYVHLGNSRVLFHKLRPTMEAQQESRIKDALGISMWIRLTGYRTEEDPLQLGRLTKAHRLAARALAYATIGEGFANTMLVLTDNGPMVIEGMQSRLSQARKTAPEEFIKWIADQYAAKAGGAITGLLAYLQVNVEHFPEYKDSENYISDVLQSDHLSRNDPDWGIVFL